MAVGVEAGPRCPREPFGDQVCCLVTRCPGAWRWSPEEGRGRGPRGWGCPAGSPVQKGQAGPGTGPGGSSSGSSGLLRPAPRPPQPQHHQSQAGAQQAVAVTHTGQRQCRPPGLPLVWPERPTPVLPHSSVALCIGAARFLGHLLQHGSRVFRAMTRNGPRLRVPLPHHCHTCFAAGHQRTGMQSLQEGPCSGPSPLGPGAPTVRCPPGRCPLGGSGS